MTNADSPMGQELPDGWRQALSGRYEIESEAGRGGMAVVYRAIDLRHDRVVAIKFLHPEYSRAVGPERFAREIETLSNLQHPNILPLFDSGDAEGTPFFVMPFVDGETLEDRIREKGALPVEESLAIARQVASALAYAHKHGVVHRDIKPGNILLTEDGAFVADFGVARALTRAGGEQLTTAGIILGTPAYMSPEQANPDGPLDGRSDIYSLGCVLFEMLSGEPPYSGRTPQAVIARHLQAEVPSIELLRPTTPPAVVQLVERSLAKIPADRFSTSDEVVAALNDSTILDATTSRRGRGLRRWVGVAAGVALIAAVSLQQLGVFERGPELDPNKIVVFPLLASGFDDGPRNVGYELAVMIEGALEHAEPLKWIDGWERLDVMQRADPQRITARDKRDITRGRGARYYITGFVQAHTDSTTVVLRLEDVAGDSLVETSPVTTATADAALHQVGIDAVKGLLSKLVDPEREIDLGPLRDRDAAAIALWIQGERQYRRSLFGTALEFYGRAVEQDSQLALAAIKGSQAASWRNSPAAGPLAQLAIERDSLLPLKYRDFAHGLAAYVNGDADSAVARFEQALVKDPEWVEAKIALGEVYYHLLPAGGPHDSVASVLFTAAADADSGFAPPLVHLTEMAVRDADVSSARANLERYERFQPEPELSEYLELMLSCVEDGPESIDWQQLALTDPLLVLRAAKSLSVGLSQVHCAEFGFRAIVEAPQETPETWGGLLGLQSLLVAQGRPDRAVAIIDSAIAVGMRSATGLYVLGALVDPAFDTKAREVDAALTDRFGTRYEESEAFGADTKWLMGSWLVSHGDTVRGGQILETLAANAERTGDRRDRMYADAMAAQVSLASGDTLAAARLLSTVRPVGSRNDLAWGYGEALPVERLALASLRLAAGEYEAAIQEASGFDHPEPAVNMLFVPQSLVLRHRAATLMERPALAARFRDRLIALGREDLL